MNIENVSWHLVSYCTVEIILKLEEIDEVN